MKKKFKVGNLVKDIKFPELGVGEVIQAEEGVAMIKVKWPRGHLWWYHPKDLEPAETPLQRMKRLYSEKE